MLDKLGTDSPDDEFHLGQFVDVTGEGEVFGFEDIKIDAQNGDLDYNDLIFSVRGATKETSI